MRINLMANSHSTSRATHRLSTLRRRSIPLEPQCSEGSAFRLPTRATHSLCEVQYLRSTCGLVTPKLREPPCVRDFSWQPCNLSYRILRALLFDRGHLHSSDFIGHFVGPPRKIHHTRRNHGAFEISVCASINRVDFQITLADLAFLFVEYLIPSPRSTAAQSRVLRR